jgi:hypothetical protein
MTQHMWVGIDIQPGFLGASADAPYAISAKVAIYTIDRW